MSEQFDHYPRRSTPPLDVTNTWHRDGDPGAWEHVCTTGECPTGNYYVSAIDGPSYWLLAGPYLTHAEALALVDRVKALCHDNHPRSFFYSFGTCRSEATKLGSVNAAGLLPNDPPTGERSTQQ